jgi:hypothetical protein
MRPLENVGGMDVYVVQSVHGAPSESANDKLCRLLFFIGALKDAGAARVLPARIPAKHQSLLHLASQAPWPGRGRLANDPRAGFA